MLQCIDISGVQQMLRDKIANLSKEDLLKFLQKLTIMLGSHDPNDMLGPAGHGDAHWMKAADALDYTIRFENDKAATAPAQAVRITQTLDEHLDPKTFRLGDFGFGDMTIQVPENSAFYQTRVDVTAKYGVFVDVEAGIDLQKHEAFWTFTTIDPATGEPTQDVLAGFLPPNTTSPEGEGWVTYSINLLPTVQSGDVVNAQAEITFDWNEPILTPLVFNTIDAASSTSAVNALPAVTNTPDFQVTWSGSDEGEGSGLAHYDVYVSTDNGPYAQWLQGTTATDAVYHGQGGHTYAFYSRATDNVGHDEDKTPTAEATTTTVVSLIDTTPPTTYSAIEGNAIGNQVVATFTDAVPGAAPADFSGSTDWGDGTAATPFSAVDVTLDAGTFVVQGSHIYAEEGTYHVTVTINDTYGQSATATNTTVLVADAPLTDATTDATHNVTAGKSTEMIVLATFTDGNPSAPLGDFTATVNWGGAVILTPSVSVQLVSRTATASTWEVLGSAIYATKGTYPISVTVHDVGGSVVDSSGKVQFIAASALLTDTTPRKTYSALEGNLTKTQILATFTDTNVKAQPGDFTATVTWAGTMIGTPTVAVQLVSRTKTASKWKVVGSATYADLGLHGLSVFVQDTAGNVLSSSGKSQIKVADAPLHDVTKTKTYASVEGSNTGPQVLATFTDANPYASLGDFTPTVTWGGALVTASTPAVALQFVSRTAKVSTWQVLGSATYSKPGKYHVSVSVKGTGGSSLVSKKINFNVADALLTDTTVATTYAAVAGSNTGSQVLATFTDGNAYAAAADFKATVNWVGKLIGKPTISVQFVSRSDTLSTWNVLGSATYAKAGTYAVKVTVRDLGGKSVSTSKTNFNVTVPQSASSVAATAAVLSVAAPPVRVSGPPALAASKAPANSPDWSDSRQSSLAERLAFAVSSQKKKQTPFPVADQVLALWP